MSMQQQCRIDPDLEFSAKALRTITLWKLHTSTIHNHKQFTNMHTSPLANAKLVLASSIPLLHLQCRRANNQHQSTTNSLLESGIPRSTFVSWIAHQVICTTVLFLVSLHLKLVLFLLLHHLQSQFTQNHNYANLDKHHGSSDKLHCHNQSQRHSINRAQARIVHHDLAVILGSSNHSSHHCKLT
jgi:hypothetical protein